MACDQMQIWIEAEKRLAVVVAKLRELEIEREHLIRVIELTAPEKPVCGEKLGDAS